MTASTATSPIDLRTVQVRRDASLRATLQADPGVRRALERFHDRSSGFGFGGRRSLLTGALRLTRSMAPDVAEAVDICRAATGFDRPVEVYVRPEPVFNAFCLKDASGLVVIGLSSRLLEAFTPAELQFVIGHELGHAAFDHFGIPMPWTARMRDLAGPIVSRPTAIELYCWVRAAELSADRAGLLCAQDAEAAGSAFFKLASGVASERVNADLESFAAQVESLASTPEARVKPRDDDDTLDCFATHPYSPVRVRALVAFSRSTLYPGATGDAIAPDELESLIERDLDLMEPGYLHDTTAHSKLLRKALFNAGMLVAAASQEIDGAELDALRALLGAERVKDDAAHIDLVGVVNEFKRQVNEITQSVDFADRVRLVQHLTIIASADGEVCDAEHDAMADIASQLAVDPGVVDQTLAGAAKPLD